MTWWLDLLSCAEGAPGCDDYPCWVGPTTPGASIVRLLRARWPCV